MYFHVETEAGELIAMCGGLRRLAVALAGVFARQLGRPVRVRDTYTDRVVHIAGEGSCISS